MYKDASSSVIHLEGFEELVLCDLKISR